MKIKIILSSILIAAFALLAGTSLAACAAGAVCIDNPLQADDLDTLINSIINFIFWIGMALAPVMFIIAGFNFVTAAGDPKKVTTAKNIMIWTAVGLGVILLAKGLVAILNGIIGV